MSPDEVMLKNAHSGKDIMPVWDAMTRPLTPEEQAAFGRQPSMFRLPDPCPFVKLGPGRRGHGVEITIGIKGTF